MTTPLNQLYRSALTFDNYPNIKETYDRLVEFNHQKNFVRIVDGVPYAKGRIYDNAVLYNSVPDFNGKRVCELGARDGLFSSWLTQFAKEVYVSDYFDEWGKGTESDLGSYDHWANIWNEAAVNPDRLHVDCSDITKLNYPDNFFDIVICTSVVEHLLPQRNWNGDISGMREMSRILKKGGYLLLSTDMTSSETKWHGGTMYYNEKDLFDRVIRPSRCQLLGNYDFSFDNHYNDNINYIEEVGLCSPAVFTLFK